jgi:hypothetical protein
MAYSRSEKAILKTVIYSDIFNSPLSENELWRFLTSDRKITKDEFVKAIKKLSSKIISKDGMYCLADKEACIEKKKVLSPEVAKKIRLAKHTAYVLSHIPTISFIGLSGGVAVGNAEKDDDVDLFIITKRNTLFVTRFFILLVLEALGLRRTRNDSHPANKICANFLIDEAALVWPVNSRDLYTARELMQMKPLFDRNGMYRKFLSANLWSKTFFPNAEPYRIAFTEPQSYMIVKFLSALVTAFPFEVLMRLVQKGLMKRFRTKEFVSDHVLAFHPYDYRRQTLRRFEKRLRELGVGSE